MSANRLTAAGRALLAAWEGSRRRAYPDAGAHLTIGVGHRLTADEQRTEIVRIAGAAVDWTAGLDPAQIEALLDQDVAWAETAVTAALGPGLAAHEFDALVLYAYNIGETAFREHSSVARRLRAGDRAGALQAWRAWNRITDPRSGRKVASAGLLRRRAAELRLFTEADYSGRP